MSIPPPWTERYASKRVSPEDAVANIKRGQRVFIGSGAAEPQKLTAALAARGDSLADNQIVHIRSLGVVPYTQSKFSEKFRYNTFFIGDNVRDSVAQGSADYTPVFLSEVPALFRRGKAPLDIALIQVTPPDAHGFCSYGVSVDIVKSAAESAKTVVAEINPNMPRTLGDAFIHADRIDMMVESDLPILEMDVVEPDDVARRIGRHIASLVEDGSTLQMGIGSIPDCVLNEQEGHRDLGVHTEMVSNGILHLIEKGVINGARKTIHRGKIITSFALGTQRLYDFINDNPLFAFYPNEYSNDPFIIAKNDRMVAINAALEIDLTGQVCSDSLGTYFYSGIGGQVDFIRGAARSKHGKPIIAMPSTAWIDGERVSRIVPTLKLGAGVVTSRGDVHFVVTEFGIVDLHGKNIRERALGLIHIAHPDFREELMRAARERHFVYSDQVVVQKIGQPELEAMVSVEHLKNREIVHIRPIQPTDEPLVQELFYRSSDQTRYMRYMAPMKALPHKQAQGLVSVDFSSSLALVVVAYEGEREVIIGVAQYFCDEDKKYADCSFMVRDDYQGMGIGQMLLKRLIEIARERGVVGFTADVLMQNSRMLHVFHECAPGPIQSQMEDGSYHIEFLLNPETEPEK